MLEVRVRWFEDADWRGYLLEDSKQALLERHAFHMWIAGVEYHHEAAEAACFAPGRSLQLTPEPDNPFDPLAIAVWNEDRSVQAGYLPARVAADLHHPPAERWGLVLEEILDDGERIAIGMLVSREEATLRVLPGLGEHTASQALRHLRRARAYVENSRLMAAARECDPVEQMWRMVEPGATLASPRGYLGATDVA